MSLNAAVPFNGLQLLTENQQLFTRSAVRACYIALVLNRLDPAYFSTLPCTHAQSTHIISTLTLAGPTVKFKCPVLNQTTKLNDSQYFQLYGNSEQCNLKIFNFYIHDPHQNTYLSSPHTSMGTIRYV